MNDDHHPQATVPSVSRRRGRVVPQCLAVGGALVTMAALFGRWGWLWELTTHFRVQYFWLLAIAAGLLAFARSAAGRRITESKAGSGRLRQSRGK